MIQTLLIANRGEIAIRIMQSCKQMKIKTVAIFSDSDADAAFVEFADIAIPLDGTSLQDTYLNIDKIIAIAKQYKVDAIHPGYGFLSENAQFAEACKQANITFVGPPSEAIQLMGDKVASRKFAEQHNVPLLKGITGTHDELFAKKDELIYPVIIKASAGGGGKGMRIVEDEKKLKSALEATAREAKAYFGNDEVFIERYIENPRHIEIQILGDKYGNIVHLFERECTIQRRHQKIIEEAPSVSLSPEQRKNISEAAVKLAEAANYYSAGTVEFIVDENMNFYFMEMNTRIQVEHPVTENITGFDLIANQIRIAEGAELPYSQQDIAMDGHSIECRIYAEDPENDFRPSPGKIDFIQFPSGEYVRVDTGIVQPQVVSGEYDPMIAKIITWGEDRMHAIAEMLTALDATIITGIPTNINYLKSILNDERYQHNQITTNYCKTYTHELIENSKADKESIDDRIPLIAGLIYDFLTHNNAITSSVWETIGFYRMNPVIPIQVDDAIYDVEIIQQSPQTFSFKIDDDVFEISGIQQQNDSLSFYVNNLEATANCFASSNNTHIVVFYGHEFKVERLDILNENESYDSESNHENNSNAISSPIPGTVVKIICKVGDAVQQGDELIIVEAMKMENALQSPRDGVIKQINVAANDKIEAGKYLIELETKPKL